MIGRLSSGVHQSFLGSESLCRWASRLSVGAHKKRVATKSDKFSLKKRLKRYDYRAEDITFPVTLPIKVKSVYSPKKTYHTTPSMHDYLPFQRMSGNEMLLNMQNADKFRNIEVVECLDAFCKLDKVSDVDWNNHELFAKVIHRINSRFSQFTTQDTAKIVRFFQRLGIKNEEFWVKTDKRFWEIHPTLHGKDFATFYMHLMKSESTSDDMKIELTKLLPRELRRFSPEHMTEAFKLVVDHDLLSEHLWHNHFHIIFWRKNLWIGLRNFPDIIEYMVKIEFLEEVEWWNESFLPSIDFYVNDELNDEVCHRMIQSLERLGVAQPAVEVSSYIAKLNERSNFLNTGYLRLQNAHFYKMVLADIEYYKQKEIAKLESQHN
jgi:hypothetical protein